MHHPSMLGAPPSMTYVTPVPSIGYDSGFTMTPLATTGNGHCTQTCLTTFISSVGAHHSTDYVAHMCLPFMLGACVPTTSSPPPTSTTSIGHATPPPLAAYMGGGGHSSSGDSISTTSAVSFTAQEIA